MIPTPTTWRLGVLSLLVAAALTLPGCSTDVAPTASSEVGPAVAADAVTAPEADRVALSFWSTAPAGKALGGDNAAKELEKAAKKAEKAAEKAEEAAEKAAEKAEEAAERAAKKAEKAARLAERAADEATRNAAERAEEAAEEAAKAADEAAEAAEAAEEAGNAAREAADLAGAIDLQGVRTASATIGPEGGTLLVELEGPARNSHDDLRVRFHVPEESLSGPEDITMEVIGSTLSELVIVFSPKGTDFDPAAKLQVHMGKDLVDIDIIDLQVRHTYGDGSSKSAAVQADKKVKSNFGFVITVLGFSRYSLAL